MEKDFQKWSEKKKIIEAKTNRPFFHEREIWFCYLGINIGSEQDGDSKEFARPIIIFRKFSKDICWVLPVTTSNRAVATHLQKYYFPIASLDLIRGAVILSQLRLIDTKRLANLIGIMKEEEFKELTKRLKALLP